MGTKYDPKTPKPELPAPLSRPPPPAKSSPVFCYALPQGFHIIETVRAADVINQHKGVCVLQAPFFRVWPLLGVETEVYVYSWTYSKTPCMVPPQIHHLPNSVCTVPQSRFPRRAWILSVPNSPSVLDLPSDYHPPNLYSYCYL